MEKNVNIPILRFPEFSNGWEKKKLGDIFSISAGGDIESKNVSQVKTDVFKYPIYANAEKNKGFYGYSNVYKVEENVLTVAGRGVNIGIAHARNHKFYPIVRLLVLKPLNNENIYFFENEINRLDLFKESTGVPQLTAPQVSGYEVCYPSPPEQQKIASFLTAVDDKLQALKKKKSLLGQYKKGVMQKIFSQELRFKDDDGNEFPEWEVKKLGEIAEKRILKNKENTVNLVFTNSAVQGIVNQRDFFDKDIANQNNLMGYYIVENNDFVYNPRISSNAPVGPISRNKLETGVMSPLYTVFRFKKGNLNFIEHFFNCNIWHEHMNNISNQGARDDRMSFLSADFYEMPISFPIQSEQTKIASFLSAIDEKIQLVHGQIEKVEIWKKGLLQKMFV